MRVAPDRWKAFVRPASGWHIGDRISFGHDGNACFLGKLEATVADKGEGGEVTLAFDLSGVFLDEALQAVGHVPLPPYIASKRPDDERDRRTTRPSMRAKRAPSPHRLPACISRRSFSPRSTGAASSGAS